MKLALCILALPITLLLCLALMCCIPRDEWHKLNDSLPPP